MAAKKTKKPLFVPQTSLLDIHQALTIINATVDTAVQALFTDLC